MTPDELIGQLTPGAPLTTTDVRFGEAELASYRAALRAPGPESSLVPEPLLVAACIRAFDATFGRVPGTLHLGQDLRVSRVPAAGDLMQVGGAVSEAGPARKGWRFQVEVEGRLADGTLCFAGRMTGQVLR